MKYLQWFLILFTGKVKVFTMAYKTISPLPPLIPLISSPNTSLISLLPPYWLSSFFQTWQPHASLGVHAPSGPLAYNTLGTGFSSLTSLFCVHFTSETFPYHSQYHSLPPLPSSPTLPAFPRPIYVLFLSLPWI